MGKGRPTCVIRSSDLVQTLHFSHIQQWGAPHTTPPVQGQYIGPGGAEWGAGSAPSHAGHTWYLSLLLLRYNSQPPA